jgi:hypothetical protein
MIIAMAPQQKKTNYQSLIYDGGSPSTSFYNITLDGTTPSNNNFDITVDFGGPQ